MPSKSFTLVENQWQPLGPLLGLTASDAEWKRLLDTVETASRQLKHQLRLRSAPLETKQLDGEIHIRCSGVAGTIGLGRVSLDVAPKFVRSEGGVADWNASTTFLLRAVSKKHFAYRRADRLAVRRLGFVDHFALAFIDACTAGLSDQVIQTYRAVDQTLPVLRGRLNIQRQLRALGRRPHLLECEVNQLDSENEFNALLKWAAEALSDRAYSASIRRSLTELAYMLPGTASPRAAMRGGRLFPPPQFRAWSDALDLAVLLAKGIGHVGAGGESGGYAFVFNMERMFEEFVESALSRALRVLDTDTLASMAQVTREYALPTRRTHSTFYSRPDNVVFRAGVPVAIVDAKYKRLSEATDLSPLHKPMNADVYELVAAMTAQGCQSGLLVYPRIVGDTELPDHLLRTWSVDAFGTQLTVGAVSIDLAHLESAHTLADLDNRLAATLAEMLPQL